MEIAGIEPRPGTYDEHRNQDRLQAVASIIVHSLGEDGGFIDEDSALGIKQRTITTSR